MTTITVTPDLIERLGNLHERIEFRDSQGELVGLYVPADPPYVNPIDGSPFTEEEIRELGSRPLNGIPGRTLQEIWNDLGAKK